MATLKNRIYGLPVLATVLRPVFARRFRTKCRAQVQNGIYPDFQSAERAIPESAPLKGYDNAEAGAMYGGRAVHPADYAALFWLRQWAKPGLRVFDFGGHSGALYDAWVRIWPEIVELDWTVFDVAAAVEEGKASNSKRARPIGFTTSAADGDGAEVWLVSGSTQYIERPLKSFLEDLKTPPKVVLINQTPLHERLSFVTLQRLTNSFCPYVIRREMEFVSDLEELGYETRDSWSNPGKFCFIPTYPEHSDVTYKGFCAVRRRET